MSGWSSDTENGGTIWTDGDVHELIEENRQAEESPNQVLHRVLDDSPQGTTGRPEVEMREQIKDALTEFEGQIRDLARQEAEDVVEEYRRRHQ